MHVDRKDRAGNQLAKQLEGLIQKMGADTVERAFSQAIQTTLKQRLQDRLGSESESNQIATMLPYPRRLLYTPSHERMDWENQRPPGYDHANLYEKDGVKTFTSEPYSLSWKDLKELVEYCEKENLEVSVTTGSPHFATACLLMEFERAKNVPLEPLELRKSWAEHTEERVTPEDWDERLPTRSEVLDHFVQQGDVIALSDAAMLLCRNTNLYEGKEPRTGWEPLDNVLYEDNYYTFGPYADYERIAKTFGTKTLREVCPEGLYVPKPGKHSSFRAWLLSQATTSDDLIGDLAQDMVRDAHLPQVDDPQELRTYFFEVAELGNDGVTSALDAAWLAYKTGLKQIPFHFAQDPRLLKAQALLQGLFSTEFYALNADILYPYRRLPNLLTGVIKRLGWEVPEESYPCPLELQEDGSTDPEHHVALGGMLSGCRKFLWDSGHIMYTLYPASHPVCRAFKIALKQMDGLRSSLEEIAAQEHKNWEIDWYYGPTVPGEITRFDLIKLVK
jgi:hypothetical protein